MTEELGTFRALRGKFGSLERVQEWLAEMQFRERSIKGLTPDTLPPECWDASDMYVREQIAAAQRLYMINLTAMLTGTGQT